MVLVDDAVLVRLLSGAPPDAVRDDELATTTAWWYRLALALARSGPPGRLSGPFSALGADERLAVQRTVDRLDRLVVVLDPRSLIPAMARVAASASVNLLSAEALAAADHLDAGVLLGVRNPPLVAAAATVGIGCALA